MPPSQVAIVDYGLGNLYSVKHACAHVGIDATITSSKQDILGAAAVILPGVGAFGDAMKNLQRLDLVSVLRDIAVSPKPLIGICLGLQLLMTESHEFGQYQGLGILRGPVVRFPAPREGARQLKVPQIGWNRIWMPKTAGAATVGRYASALLEGIADGVYLYFVHSFIVQPDDSDCVVSITRYGHVEFCSSLQKGNVFACQFHPERSGVEGLKVYRNLARLLKHAPEGESA